MKMPGKLNPAVIPVVPCIVEASSPEPPKSAVAASGQRLDQELAQRLQEMASLDAEVTERSLNPALVEAGVWDCGAVCTWIVIVWLL